MKSPAPAKLTAKTADERKANVDGWFESPSGNAALVKVREAFVAEYVAYLTAKLEKGKYAPWTCLAIRKSSTEKDTIFPLSSKKSNAPVVVCANYFAPSWQ